MTQETTSDGSIDTEAISIRAFQLYESRGCIDGCDVEDWLEAERQLRSEAANPQPGTVQESVPVRQ